MPRFLSMIRIDEQNSPAAGPGPEFAERMGALFEEITKAGVAGSIRGHLVGRLLVTDVQGTEQEHHRTPRLIREADNAFFQVAIVADGSAGSSRTAGRPCLIPATASFTRTPGRSSGSSTATGTSGFSRYPSIPCG